MADWRPRFSVKDLAVTENQRCYDGFFKINRLTIRHSLFQGGSIEITREQFQREDAVCVLLFDPERDCVVLIEQFRVGAIPRQEQDGSSPWLLELVAGIVEPGETAEDVARREAVEEAGARLGEIVPITRYLPSAGGSDEWVDLLLARVDSRNLGGVHGLADEGEDILVHLIPLADAVEMVRNGKINNAATIIALQWLQLNKTDLISRWGIE